MTREDAPTGCGPSVGEFLIASAESLVDEVQNLTIDEDADRVYWNVERDAVRQTVRLLRKCDDAITFALTGQHVRPLWTYDRARIEAEQQRAGEYEVEVDEAVTRHPATAELFWSWMDRADEDPPESETERYWREREL